MEKIEQIKTELEMIHLPRWNELSQIPLYMDQLLNLLNQKLDPLFFMEEEQVLTRSMVNNYVKNSIVRPPVKKQYDVYHQAYLMIVILLKPCFTMQEISQMLKIYNLLEHVDVNEDYNRFIEIYESGIHQVIAEGRIRKPYYEQPTKEQHLMETAIQTVVNHMYTQFLLYKMNDDRK